MGDMIDTKMNDLYKNNPQIQKMKSSIIIMDDFIKDEKLLKEIENDTNFFPKGMGTEPRQLISGNVYHEKDASIYSPWFFWDGWWKTPANTVKKKVVQAIWQENLPCPLVEVVGFEYWTRTYSPGQYLPIHLDEDTFAYEKNGEFRCPMIGAVYYPHFSIGENQDPGYLEIYQGRIPVDRNKKHQLKCIDTDSKNINDKRKMVEFLDYYQPENKIDRISYRPNRLIILDAGLTLHGTTPTGPNSQRFIMGINVWHIDERPTGYSDLAGFGFHYE